MRTIIWFIYFWLYQIFALPKYLILKGKFKRGEDITQQVHETAMNWATRLVRLTGSKIDVVGLKHIPSDRSVVFVANHQSNFDIPLMLGYIDKPKGFIAKAETKKLPIVGGWMSYMKCVFMDRKNPRAALKAIKSGIQIVKDGHSIVIFPEGTRSADGQLNEFKPGSFKLAMKSGAPIIPVTIKGSIDIMKKGSKWIKPAKVQLIISEPVSSEGYESTESYLLREKVYDIIKSNLA